MKNKPRKIRVAIFAFLKGFPFFYFSLFSGVKKRENYFLCNKYVALKMKNITTNFFPFLGIIPIFSKIPYRNPGIP